MAMTQVSLYFNMCRYTQTVMCAVNNVKNADKKREKTDSLTQIYKYTRWRNDLLPLLDLKNSIFCASPEKYKTIILHRCLLLLCNSYSLFLHRSLKLPFSLAFSLWSRATFVATSRQVYLHICIILSSSHPYALLHQVFRFCAGFQCVSQSRKHSNSLSINH